MNSFAATIAKRFNSSSTKTYDLNKHFKAVNFPFLINPAENHKTKILKPHSEHTHPTTFGQYNSLQSFQPKFRNVFVEKKNYLPRIYKEEDVLLVRKDYKNNNTIISALTPEELSLDPKFVNKFIFLTGEIKGKHITRLTTTNQKKIEQAIKLMRSNVMLSTRHKFQQKK